MPTTKPFFRKAKNQRPEQLLQIGIFNQLRPLMKAQQYKQFMAFQIRNETGVQGQNGARLGEIARSMGTMSGVTDIALLIPRRPMDAYSDYSPQIIFIELKARKPLKTEGRETDPISLLSDTQKEFRERVMAMGFDHRIIAAENHIDAIDQMYAILREYGVQV